jgi:glycerol-3-phosphate dehydrogenase (NAD(P)+)
MAATRFSVLVLGHGEMGRSMEHLLSRRHALAIWERNLEDGTENIPLEQAAAGRDFVIFALPAIPHGELAGRISAHIPAHCVCLSIAKGLDDQGRTPAAALAGSLGPGGHFGVIYGPMIAEELRAGRPGFADLGAARADNCRRAQELFSGAPLYLRHSTDVIGISWAAILKNLYVPLLGAAEEAGLGDNVRGYLASAVLEEIARIIELKGGRRATAYGLAGLGDLVTTATSAGSHHRQVGRDLVHCEPGDSCGSGANVHSEGIHSLNMVRRHHLLDVDSFPVMRLVRDIVDEPRNVGGRLQLFLDASLGRGDARNAGH